MHAPQVLIRQRKRHQPISLDIVQPQLRRIGQPGRLKRQRWSTAKFPRSHPADLIIKIRIQRRWRRRQRRIGLYLQFHRRVIHELVQIIHNRIDRISWQQPHVQVRARFRGYDVVGHARGKSVACLRELLLGEVAGAGGRLRLVVEASVVDRDSDVASQQFRRAFVVFAERRLTFLSCEVQGADVAAIVNDRNAEERSHRGVMCGEAPECRVIPEVG